MTSRRTRILGATVLFAGLAAVPLLGAQASTLETSEYVFSLLLVAVGLNIVTGFAGQLSLGPGATFAVSGYAAAVLANEYPTHVGLVLMCVAGIVSSVVVGFFIGIPALRVGGFYLAMTTLFFALIVPIVAGNWSLTGAAQGISLLGNANFDQKVSGSALYEVCLAGVLLALLASWALLTCRVGRRFVTLRSSEELATSLGMSGYRTKVLAFVLSAVPAGLGGAFYAYSQQFMAPGSVTTNTSIYLLAACVIGGLGTVLGPLVGGLVTIGLSQFIGGFKQYEGIVFGLVLIACSVLLPEGIMGVRLHRMGWLARVGRRRRAVLVAVLRNARLVPRPSGGASEPPPEATDDAFRPPAGVSPVTTGGPAGAPGSGGGAPGASEGGEGARLSVSDALRRFGGVAAVDGVSLEVRPGSVHGLIGSNGSGKTTLLNLVSGYHRLERGEVRLGASRVDGGASHRAARLGIARTFQTPKLVVPGTVLTNVVVAADVAHPARGLSSFLRLPAGRRADRRASDRARSCLDWVGLGPQAEQDAGELPHGMRRLVELARALALAPRFVLLDEPAAGLSPAELDVLRRVVRDLVDRGVGVLLVEHNIPLVMELADEVTVMHQGRCLAQGPPDVIRTDPEVARAFLGRSIETAGPGRGDAGAGAT